MNAEKTMKLLKFGADFCGPCRSLKRRRTLEKFAADHDDVELEIVDVEEDEELADEYNVKGIPALFFESGDGDVLAKTVGAVDADELEKLYQKAKRKLGKGKEDDEEKDNDDGE